MKFRLNLLIFFLVLNFSIFVGNSAFDDSNSVVFDNSDFDNSNTINQAFNDPQIQEIGIRFTWDEIQSSFDLDSSETDKWIDLANQYDKDIYFEVLSKDGKSLVPETASGTIINWNPGMYFGFKNTQFQNDDGSWKDAETVLSRNAMCKPGGEHVKGMRLKFEWGLFERDDGQFDYTLFDDILQYFRSGGCGGIERRLLLGLDFKALNAEARQGLCVPSDLADQQVYWEEGSQNKERCAGNVWDPGEVRDRYTRAVTTLANRYKDEPLVEYFTGKGEGAFGVDDAPTFTYDKLLDYLADLAVEVKDTAPKVAYVFGTNNFKVNEDDRLLTVYKPVMDSTPGFGLRWPDTWTITSGARIAQNLRTSKYAPFTRHHVYYPQFRNRFMMAGELQRPWQEFETFDDAWQACCNPQGYNDPLGADANFNPATSDHSWGVTHVTVITTSNDRPEEDAITAWESRDWQMYSSHCPTSWVEDGAKCVTGKTNSNPGIIVSDQSVPTTNGYSEILLQINNRYNNENNFKGYFSDGESSSGGGDNGGGGDEQDPPEDNGGFSYCHKYQTFNNVDSRYGKPYFPDERRLYLKSLCSDSSVKFEAGWEGSNYLTYKEGYIYKNNQWEKVSLTGDQVIGDWIRDEATATVSGVDLNEESYMLIYLCRWIEGEWRCGCRNKACTESKWNVQAFQR